MSTPVHFCSLFSISYSAIGNILPQQSFHVFWCSIPEYGTLSAPVHPRVQQTSMEVPDAY